MAMVWGLSYGINYFLSYMFWHTRKLNCIKGCIILPAVQNMTGMLSSSNKWVLVEEKARQGVDIPYVGGVMNGSIYDISILGVITGGPVTEVHFKEQSKEVPNPKALLKPTMLCVGEGDDLCRY